jgi:hypothetical protein
MEIVHLTSVEGAAGIAASGRLGGRFGLYGLEAGRQPASQLGQVAWAMLGPESLPGRIATGTLFKDLRESVSIGASSRYFGVPPMFGPWSAYRNLLGVRTSPLGYLETKTGEFFPGRMAQTGAVATRLQYLNAVSHQWFMDYGIDGLLYLGPKVGLSLNQGWEGSGYSGPWSRAFVNPNFHP